MAQQDEPAAESPAKRVLVVDDDVQLTRVVGDLLAAEGFHCETATGGDQALRALATRPFHLVVLDRHMPEIDGLEVLHWIRQQPELTRLPVIFLTADDSPDSSVSGFREGADDYVVKPFDPEILVARIRRRLETTATWSGLVELEAKRRQAMRTVAELAAGPGDVLSISADLCEQLVLLDEVAEAVLFEVAGDVCGVVAAAGRGELSLTSILDGTPEASSRLIDALTEAPRYVSLRDRDGRAAVAPIRAARHVVGFLVVVPPDPDELPQSDVAMGLAVDFAALASGVLGRAIQATAGRRIDRHRIERILADHSFHSLFAPVLDLRNHAVVGHRVSTRFYDGDSGQVFATADAAGLGTRLRVAVARDVARRARIFDPGQWLIVETSPHEAVPDELWDALSPLGTDRIVLDVTTARRRRGTVVPPDLSGLPDGVRLLVDHDLADVYDRTPVILAVPDSITRRLADDRHARADLAARRHLAAEMGAELLATDLPDAPALEYFAELSIDLAHGASIGKPIMVG